MTQKSIDIQKIRKTQHHPNRIFHNQAIQNKSYQLTYIKIMPIMFITIFHFTIDITCKIFMLVDWKDKFKRRRK